MNDRKRTDELIDRIASNEADAAEFRAFSERAKAAPAEWERMARAMRDELQMRLALQAEDHAARAEAEVVYALTHTRGESTGRAAPYRVWSGWAAAALIALAWTVFALLPQQATTTLPESLPSEARLVSLTADDALEQYLEIGHNEGRIITELPARMVEMESAEDGGMVVYYIRQLLEKERVDEMYRYAEDELGRPFPVPIDFSSISVTDSSL